jgi:preprotein translocase subunit SecG
MKWLIALLVGFGIILVGFRWAGWLLSAFFVMNCVVLIIVVLLQSGKAADLAGAFGGAGSQTAFGPRGAASVLSQATTWCAIMFMVCALAMVVRVDRAVANGEGGGGSILQQFSRPATKTTPAPTNNTPAAPTTPQPAAPQSSTPQPQQQPTPAPAKPTPKKP